MTDPDLEARIRARIDGKTKPPGSLGRVEDLAARIARLKNSFAPRMETFKIPPEKIGFLIGPGGRNIKQMQSDYQVRIAILDEEGSDYAS